MSWNSRWRWQKNTGTMPAMFVYALTIFTGAFLLFQVQPLIGKYILPWFGGAPGVWTACLLFFQALLLGGYAYAHFLSRRFQPRLQAVLHLVLLAAALALLPITPADSWKPGGGGNPTLQILGLLLVSIGLPYFVLSATSPLMQHWFSWNYPGALPYRLYALSNVGSLLALVSYPIYFETHFSRKLQALLWGWGLAAYAIACSACALKLWRAADDGCPKSKVQSPKSEADKAQTTRTATLNSQPTTLNRLFWLLLPACASILLLATTNKICQDVAVVPFLWVLPLAIYLLSFIICFDHPRWYVRFPFSLALVAALGGICWAIYRGNEWPIGRLAAVHCGALFVCAMVCHGELYRLRPDPRLLTRYYLMIASGGALGGAFVAVVAPVIFTRYYELHFGALLCAALFLVVCLRDRNSAETNQWRWMAWALSLAGLGGLSWLMAYLAGECGKFFGVFFRVLCFIPWTFLILLATWAISWRKGKSPANGARVFLVLVFAPWMARRKFADFLHWQRLACAWLAVGLLALTLALWFQRERFADTTVYVARNFYGVLRVLKHDQDNPPVHVLYLLHGHVKHGYQVLEPGKNNWPTLYYGEKSGVGLVLAALPAGNRRIGVVGLGAGTLAAYGRPGDFFRFYEINPEVQRVAQSPFSFLANCRGKVDIVMGDARLSLEKEPSQQFDLLALDAFDSDAIPVHLLTLEAFEIYNRHLKPNGVIAIHISNNILDLEPVAANLAVHFNYQVAVVDNVPAPEEWWLNRSIWVLLTRNAAVLHSPGIQNATRPVETGFRNIPLWTDDFSSLFQILK